MRCVRTCPAVDKGRRTEEPDSQMASAASTTSYTLHQLGFRAVAPIPPGAWPGEGGDTAAAFLRAKARHCKENPPGPDFAGVTPKFGN